jgi:arabinofuranosyltransferase
MERLSAVKRRVLVAAAWALAFAALTAALHDQALDDAFITFRYGENLARGRGPVFNPGQPLLGTTSPGALLLSALLHALVGHGAMPAFMCAVGCAGIVAQAAALRALCAPLGAAAAWAAALSVLLGAGNAFAFVPLETHEAVAFGLWSLVLVERRRDVLGGLSAGLAALFRPDALIWAVLALAVFAARERDLARAERVRRLARPLAAFVLVLAPWLLFAWAYYGSPVPLTLAAKYQRHSLGGYLRHLYEHLPDSWWTSEALSSGVRRALSWLAVGAGACAVARLGPARAALAAFPLLHLAAYCWLRPFTEHVWHVAPAAITLAALGVAGLVRTAVRLRWPLRAPLALALGLLAAAWFTRALASRDARAGYWGGRYAVYRDVASYLRAHGAAERDAFEALEVGTIAYYSDFSALDLGGLVNSAATPPPSRTLRFDVLEPRTAYHAAGRVPLFRAAASAFSAEVYAHTR